MEKAASLIKGACLTLDAVLLKNKGVGCVCSGAALCNKAALLNGAALLNRRFYEDSIEESTRFL